MTIYHNSGLSGLAVTPVRVFDIRERGQGFEPRPGQ